MNSFIFYLGTFYVVIGTIFLSVPIVYLELGKPKDLIKAFLNLLIGLILIVKNKTIDDFKEVPEFQFKIIDDRNLILKTKLQLFALEELFLFLLAIKPQ